MLNDLSDVATSTLLQKIYDQKNRDKDFNYRAVECVLKRWRQGTDLEILVGLLESEKSSDRLRGVYYLGELGEAVEGLKAPVIQLVNDPLSNCRRAFVEYMATAGYFDETIANALAKCLQDLDIYVRVATIKWAIQVSDEKFEKYCQLVEAGAGSLEATFQNPLSNDFWINASRKRAIRGLNIALRIRAGQDIQDIKIAVPEEDSFVLDNIHFSRTRRERYLEWKKIRT